MKIITVIRRQIIASRYLCYRPDGRGCSAISNRQERETLRYQINHSLLAGAVHSETGGIGIYVYMRFKHQNKGMV